MSGFSSNQIREKFLKYFSERGHTAVPSSSLLPDDPSVLLTTAGMQQFKPYYFELDSQVTVHPSLGAPIGKNATSSQKSFRTSDIDEVGDESHLTFFEMLGNFSFGGYFKEESIKWAHEFLTCEMNLEIDYVTVFDPKQVKGGDWRAGVPFDEQSYNIWKDNVGLSKEKIKHEGTDNFWGPTGSKGPCGPTTEIYVKNARGQSIEIWNIVFNEYLCKKDKSLEKLLSPGVDTGMGLERLAMVNQNTETIFETDLFMPLINLLPEEMPVRIKRIMADHARGIAFLLADGVVPSNKEAGYMLRRLMRRVIVHGGRHGVDPRSLLRAAVKTMNEFYPELDMDMIIREFDAEDEKFSETLESGMKALVKLKTDSATSEELASTAFDMYQSYGLPIEISIEVFEGWGVEFDTRKLREAFDMNLQKHQEISRAGIEQKFGGHGLMLDTGELKAGNEEDLKKVTRLHTATHLMHQALRDVLGESVAQRGSDITVERTRFDFSFDRKMTDEEKAEVERIVNEKIKEDLAVQYKEFPIEEAKKTGALHFFKEKYPEVVKVYYIGESIENAYSKEFCGGPHVTHTGEIGQFKIKKEQSSSAGVRRIRAIVE